ncbi:MAG: hypothetical protein HYS39_00880 [Proteobacteria bacterium]|nr:hypothetical protein [Pseudomonadota bacterium]
MTNILALSIPLFVRAVYDWVIPVQSGRTLGYFCIGLGLAFAIHHLLHMIKSRSLAYMGARLNMIIGTQVFRQILSLPVGFVEGATVGQQIARIRQFDTTREIFTSIIAQLMIDGPFSIFFLIILGLLGGLLFLYLLFLFVFF